MSKYLKIFSRKRYGVSCPWNSRTIYIYPQLGGTSAPGMWIYRAPINQTYSLQWLGHVQQISNWPLPKPILYSELTLGKIKRFYDTIHNVLKGCNLGEAWEEICQDRNSSRATCYNNTGIFLSTVQHRTSGLQYLWQHIVSWIGSFASPFMEEWNYLMMVAWNPRVGAPQPPLTNCIHRALKEKQYKVVVCMEASIIIPTIQIFINAV